MNDTIDETFSASERVGDRIEQVCADIDGLLTALREQARQLKEIGDDEQR